MVGFFVTNVVFFILFSLYIIYRYVVSTVDMVNLRSVEEHVQGIKDGFFQLNFMDMQVIEIESLITCINGLCINHLDQFIVDTILFFLLHRRQ